MARSKTELLLSFQNEITKEHIEYDGFGRISKMYVAFDDAVDGDPVIVKEFLYHGLTNTVKGRAEGYAVWDGTWDLAPALDNLNDALSNRLTDDMGNYLTEL